MSVTLSDEDYKRLLLAAETDDMIIFCEKCGAWMDRDDPRAATVEDFTGCWYAATCDEKLLNTCVKLKRPSADAIS